MPASLAFAVIVFVFAGVSSSHAQLIMTVEPESPLNVEAGEETCYEITYAWSSTTLNATDTEIVVTLPSIFGGSSPADFNALTLNPHIDSVTFDEVSRELVFDFIDPLPAGSSGVLQFCVVYPNGTTEDGTTSTIGIDFTSPGQTTNSNPVVIEADAESKVKLTKSTAGGIAPAKGEATPYSITVDNNQGTGNYDLLGAVVTDVLPPGAVFLGSSPAPVSVTTDDNGTVGDATDDVTTVVWNVGDVIAGRRKIINLSVRYDDEIGTPVANTANLDGSDPFSAPVTRTVTDTSVVSEPTPSAVFLKSASTTKVSLATSSDDVTETIFYSFDIENDGNVALQDYVVEDYFPAGFYPTRLWTGYDARLLQQNNVKIEYQLDSAPGTWVEHASSPFVSPLETDPVFESPENNEVDLSVLGGNVIAVRWTYDSLPVAYHNEANTRIFGEYRAPAAEGTTLTNLSHSSDPADTAMVTVPSEVDVEIVGASPRPLAKKVIVGPSSAGPTENVTYRISVNNSFGGSTDLSSPIATDVLPPHMSFVPGSVIANPPLTSFSETIDATTGRPLLTFDWTGQDVGVPVSSPSPGLDQIGTIETKTFMVEFQVQIEDGTLAQELVNDADLTYTEPLINDSSGSPESSGPVVFTVLDSAILDSAKWVVGDLDIPTTSPADLDFADVATGNDRASETRFPDVGKVVPGGQLRYRVSLYNPGNEILENVTIMEILPHIGDIGVVATSENRESTWSPTLITHSSQSSVFPDAIKYDANGSASSQVVGVQWSTSSNPIRSDLSPILGDPTGGDSGSFSASALSADLSSVKSLLLTFPGMTLNPLEGVEFYFYLQVPEDAPFEEVAWNSIGRSANVVGITTPIPPAEPLKVGIAPNSVSLGDLVWIDSTAGAPATSDNGIYDSGAENVMPNAKVELFQYVDGVLQRAQSAFAISTGLTDEVTPAGSPLLTDENGLYSFEGLMPSGTSYDGVLYGDFVVQVSPPDGLADQYVAGSTGAAGYEADPNLNGNNNNNGIAFGPGNVLRSGDITLTLDSEPLGDGQTGGDDADGNLTVDFAFIANEVGAQLANLGDVLWLDEDADGTRDSGEALIEGAIIELFDANTGLPVLDSHGDPAVPFDSAGNPLTDGKTGADGFYEFIDLLPGDYVVKVTPPAPPIGSDPYQLTPVNGALNDENHGELATAGLGNIAVGDIVSPTVTLNAGDENHTIDFGLIRPLSLGDTVWIDGSAGDANAGNGTQDSIGAPGEAPLAGVTVELFNADGTPATHIDGSPVLAQVTDSNGNYLFTDLLPGDYIVRVAPQPNYELTVNGGDPDDDDNTDSNAGLLAANLGNLSAGDIVSDPVTLDIGLEPINDGDTNPDSNLSVDFGFVPVPANVVSLGNRVWYDQNANGLQDPGELDIEGAIVELFNSDGTPAIDAYLDPVGPVTTSGGAYSFGDLLPGDYIVKITPPAGSDYFVTPLTSADTSDAASDTDNNGSLLGAALGSIPAGSIVSPVVNLAVGENDPKIDFGLTQAVSVGNYVWVDSTASGATQGNGIQDAGENPFPGAIVWLLMDDPGNPGTLIQATDVNGDPVPSVTTDSNGLYQFGSLLPGDYVVGVEEPLHYNPSDFGNANGDPNDETGTYLTDNNGASILAIDIDGAAGDETLVVSGPVTLHAGLEPTLDDGAGAVFGNPDVNGNGAVDFGFVPEPDVVNVSVGNFVWLDENRDGIFNGAEAGIAGATVSLLDASGNPVLDADLNPVLPQVTDGTGAYNFVNLIPGDYIIRVTPPADHAVVKIGGADPDTDSTVDDSNALQVGGQTYGQTPIFTLSAGEMDPTLDFGLVELVSIGDYVWFDLNADGQQDGESGVAGATVALLMEDPANAGTYIAATDAFGNAISPQVTDGDGLYDFGNLYPGNFKVRVTPPTGMILTPNGGLDPDIDPSNTDNNGVKVAGQGYVESLPVTLEPNTEPSGDGGAPDDNNGNYTVDFGFIEPVSIGDFVWFDLNADGLQSGESGLAGATVELLMEDPNNAGSFIPAVDADGVAVTSQLTDGTGAYNFGNLLPGEFKVRVTPPAVGDYLLTPNGGADPDSDPSNVDNNGKLVAGQNYVETDAVTLTVRGETGDGDANANNNPSVDIGFIQTVSIGDYVWLDTNGDGLQDGEAGLAGANVELLMEDPNNAGAYIPATDYLGVAVPSQTTDGTGAYNFGDLLQGDYIVRVTPPVDHLLTQHDGGDPDLVSSDNDNNGNIVTGQPYVESDPVTLTIGDEPLSDGQLAGIDANGNMSVDFGFVRTVAIGSFVFDDTSNQDGDLTGDPGLEGAVVELFVDDPANPGTLIQATDVNGDPVASQTTLADGAYGFDDLYPGDYVVRVTPPAGYGVTPVNENDPNGNASDLDSNGQPVSGESYAQSVPVTLTLDGEPTGEGTDSNGRDADGNGTIDFGFVQTVSVGNYVWLDVNVDGDQTGESGLAGAVVSLWIDDPGNPGSLIPATDASGATVANQTTDGTGFYEFLNLLEGEYVVRVQAPSGHFLTPHGGLDPDVDPSNLDNNGAAVAGETYVQSAPILLEVGNEPPGDGVSGNPFDTNGNLTVDFGFYEPVSLGDYVWFDRNGDGTQDASELGLEDALVELLMEDPNNAGAYIPATDKDGVAVASQTTGADGLYSFGNLLPGDFKVRVTPPADYLLTAGVGANPQTDNNGLVVSGQPYVESVVVNLTNGAEIGDGDADANNDPTIDFGFVQLVSIGDYVWFDANGDGLQDGEAGLAGADVELLMEDPNNAGTFIAATDYTGAAIPSQTTDSTGAYHFGSLLEGDYIVRVTPPVDHLLTPHDGGDPDLVSSNNDNNGNIVTGQPYVESDPVTLMIGDEALGDGQLSGLDGNGDMTVDFGFVQTVAIGSFVFDDSSDRDGQQTGNPGLEGALVELLVDDPANPGTLIQATDVDGNPVVPQTTLADGVYGFDDLYPGDYVVRVTPPVGYGVTPINENDPNGNANDLDSNGQPVSGESYAQSVPVTLTLGGEPTGEGTDSNGRDADGNGTIDFGFVQTVSVGNYVWLDVNVDGEQTGESGLAGAVVSLWIDDPGNPGSLIPATDASGAPVGAQMTDGTGFYEFLNLQQGEYIVRVQPPAGHFLTPHGGLDPDTDPSNLDNNGIAVTGETYVQSAPILLEVGNEPPGDGVSGNPIDTNGNLTVDFGFYEPVSLGDYVWFDRNGDGNPDPTETAFEGAVVFLDLNGNGVLDVDEPSDTTDIDGHYMIEGLIPGTTYTAVIDESTLPAGVVITGDPDVTVDGKTTVTAVAGEDIDTVDFGFTKSKSAAIADYYVDNSTLLGLDDNSPPGVPAIDPLTGDPTGAVDNNGDDKAALTDNVDGDVYNNLLEFALCFDPGSGTYTFPNGTPNEGFHLELTGGTLNASFHQPAGVTDVTYVLQSSTDGQTWTDLESISPTTGSGSVVGSSVVTYGDVIGTLGTSGLLRLEVSAGSTTSVTGPIGWQMANVKDFCQTYSDPLLETCLVTGTIDGVLGQVLDLTQAAGTQGLTARLETGKSYYLEVMSGDNVGHIFDIESFTADSITLAVDTDLCALSAPYSTKLTVPADLVADRFFIREHKTLESLFPIDDPATGGDPEGFAVGANANNSGKLIRYDREGGLETYIANSAPGGAGSWVASSSGLGAPDNILPPGEGIFTHNLLGEPELPILQFGEVRTTQLAVPLKEGYNFVASAHPIVSQSIDGDDSTSRLMNASGSPFAFEGNGARSLADQVQFWQDDTAADAGSAHICYDMVFYLRNASGTVDLWSKGGTATPTMEEVKGLFQPTRSAMYCIQEDDMPAYYIPSPISNAVNE